MMGDLPAPFIVALMYAGSLIGACVAVHAELDRIRRHDTDLLMEHAARTIQSAARGRLARLRKRKGGLGRATFKLMAAVAKHPADSELPHASIQDSRGEDARMVARRLTRMNTVGKRTGNAVAAVGRRRAKERLHLVYLRMHVVLLTMLSK